MKLVRIEALLEWNKLKESRQLLDSESVVWKAKSWMLEPDHILDPVAITVAFVQGKSDLYRTLHALSSITVVEYKEGCTVRKPDDSLYQQAMKQTKELVQTFNTMDDRFRVDCSEIAKTWAALLNRIIQCGLFYSPKLFEGIELSAATQHCLERIKYREGGALCELNRLLLEDVFSGFIKECQVTDQFSLRIVFVSHRWMSPNHPDPDGIQLQELQNRLRTLCEADDCYRTALVFYDYCSMPQRPRTADEDGVFYSEIGMLKDVIQYADKVLILSEGFTDYVNRGWCFYEFTIFGRGKIHFFDNQNDVREAIKFLSGFRPAPSINGSRVIVTSDQLSYKIINTQELAGILGCLHHLDACRTTHPEDAPLLKSHLIRDFNSRDMTAFGRLVAGISKHFKIMVVESLNLHGENYGPALMLSRDDMDKPMGFVNRFRIQNNWDQYLVEPGAATDAYKVNPFGHDPFPTIDHVMHTILERTNGIVLGTQCIYLPLMKHASLPQNSPTG